MRLTFYRIGNFREKEEKDLFCLYLNDLHTELDISRVPRINMFRPKIFICLLLAVAVLGKANINKLLRYLILSRH